MEIKLFFTFGIKKIQVFKSFYFKKSMEICKHIMKVAIFMIILNEKLRLQNFDEITFQNLSVFKQDLQEKKIKLHKFVTKNKNKSLKGSRKKHYFCLNM